MYPGGGVEPGPKSGGVKNDPIEERMCRKKKKLSEVRNRSKGEPGNVGVWKGAHEMRTQGGLA